MIQPVTIYLHELPNDAHIVTTTTPTRGGWFTKSLPSNDVIDAINTLVEKILENPAHLTAQNKATMQRNLEMIEEKVRQHNARIVVQVISLFSKEILYNPDAIQKLQSHIAKVKAITLPDSVTPQVETISTLAVVLPTILRLETKAYDTHAKKEIEVEAHLITQTKFSRTYQIVDTQSKRRAFGYIELYIVENHVNINIMRNETRSNGKSHIQKVGTALHELAFKVSIQSGRKGHVTLSTAHGSDVFHWKSGFRYSFELSPFGGINEKCIKYGTLVREYLSAEPSQRDTLQKQIENDPEYTVLQRYAKKMTQFLFKRDPETFLETCTYGLSGSTVPMLNALEVAKKTGNPVQIPEYGFGGSMRLPAESIEQLKQKFKLTSI